MQAQRDVFERIRYVCMYVFVCMYVRVCVLEMYLRGCGEFLFVCMFVCLYVCVCMYMRVCVMR